MVEPETNDPTTNPAASGAPSGASDVSPDAENGADDSGELAAHLAAAKTEAAANYDKFMRVAADLENFRRRTVREKDELRTTATGRVLEDIFPVLDTLTLAINAAKQP